MKVLFLTDIHFGSKFLTLSKISKLVKLVIDRWDVIILGGDIFDMWLFPQKDAQGAPFKAARPFINALKQAKEDGAKIVYVIGNHDYEVRSKNLFPDYGYADNFTFEDGGKKFLFEHGHQYDPYNKGKGTFTAKLLTSLQGLASVFGIDAIKKIEKWSFAKEADEAMRLAQRDKIVKKNTGKCDVYIYGHTHTQERYELKDLLVINTGDIIDHGTYAVVIDGKVELKRL